MQAPGELGEFELLPGHVPMLTALKPGVLTIGTKARARYAVSSGYLRVDPAGAVEILVEQAMPAKDIDAEARARRISQTAEAELAKWGDKPLDGDYTNARAARRLGAGPPRRRRALIPMLVRADGVPQIVYNMQMQPMLRSPPSRRHRRPARAADRRRRARKSNDSRRSSSRGQLGVSRTPLREALLILEREGLVVSEVNKGFRVARCPRRASRELFPILGTLEAWRCAKAASG